MWRPVGANWRESWNTIGGKTTEYLSDQQHLNSYGYFIFINLAGNESIINSLGGKSLLFILQIVVIKFDSVFIVNKLSEEF